MERAERIIEGGRSVAVAEVHRFAEVIGLSRAAPERYSVILAFELYCRTTIVPRPFNPAKIVAEVQALEGLRSPVGTKDKVQFKHGPLKGFWKKHYLESGLRSVALNIQLGLGNDGPELAGITRKSYNPATANLPFEVVAKNIANATVNIYAERARRQHLTGEWIIFSRHRGKNYYLSLALHEESHAEIFDRIKRGCASEFPFLF